MVSAPASVLKSYSLPALFFDGEYAPGAGVICLLLLRSMSPEAAGADPPWMSRGIFRTDLD